MRLGQIINQEKETIQDSKPKYTQEQIKHLKMLLIDTAKKNIPNFKIDVSNKAIIANLFNYFLGLKGEYDVYKGLWLMGDVGTGKSSLMNVFSIFMRDCFRNGFKVYICSKVSNDYAINGDLDPYTYNMNGYSGVPVEMCFDELGRETIPANHFGQKLNVLQHILHIRYSLWQVDKLRTFITTNCDPEDINELYDGENDKFISDRIKEMFNTIIMTGKSRR